MHGLAPWANTDYTAPNDQSRPPAAPNTRDLPQAGVVLVKNGTADDLERFHVLGIDRPIFTPGESLFSFQDQIAVVGITPTEDDHLGRFLVLQEPLRAGMIGRACVSGVRQRRLASPRYYK